MPAKNSRKLYSSDSYYHIYNRGVEKHNIFSDLQDYGVFLSYLKEYLLPKDEVTLLHELANPSLPSIRKDQITRTLRMNNFAENISLLSYCLMPNHYHLLIHQNSMLGIDVFMNSLGSRYTRYFNKKHNRVGTLYQDVYKAVEITSNEQLLHLTRYIHRNPFTIASQDEVLQGSPYFSQPSSYPEYLELRKTPWVHPEVVLSSFSKTYPSLTYQAFVNGDEQIEPIKDVMLDL